MCFCVLGVFGLYIDVLGVSIRFSVIFCTHEQILKYMFGFFEVLLIFEFKKSIYKIILNGPPSPSLASAKVSCLGASKFEKDR